MSNIIVLNITSWPHILGLSKRPGVALLGKGLVLRVILLYMRSLREYREPADLPAAVQIVWVKDVEEELHFSGVHRCSVDLHHSMLNLQLQIVHQILIHVPVEPSTHKIHQDRRNKERQEVFMYFIVQVRIQARQIQHNQDVAHHYHPEGGVLDLRDQIVEIREEVSFLEPAGVVVDRAEHVLYLDDREEVLLFDRFPDRVGELVVEELEFETGFFHGVGVSFFKFMGFGGQSLKES